MGFRRKDYDLCESVSHRLIRFVQMFWMDEITLELYVQMAEKGIRKPLEL